MHTKENKWTPEEEELLALGLYPTELSKHPLMIANGRTRGAINRKIQRDKEKANRPPKQPKPPKENVAQPPKPRGRKPIIEPDDAYKGHKVQLYQFIKTKEANLDRVKQWKRKQNY